MPIIIKNELITLASNPSVKILGDDFLTSNFESCSYDLRIGAVFIGDKIISQNHQQNNNWNIEVKPSEIVTIITIEEVNLPKDICATVFALNSLSSTGFLILNPGHIDPGYKGPISICGINLSKETKVLSVGSKIFTIIFDRLSYDAEGYKNDDVFLGLSRKLKEENFSINKARKLSRSLFDLIKENEYKHFLTKLITEIMNKRLLTFITYIGVLIGIFAGGYGILQFYKDEKIQSLKKIVKQDSAIKNRQSDTINYYKVKIDSLQKNEIKKNQQY
jgi:deoxycytidine triphosphate deaminase